MDNLQLQKLVEQISREKFQKEFKHVAFFNPRLRTTGGRYLLQSHNIEINKKYYEERGIEELVGIIKHELCHYHLHLERKGYQHRDRDFRELLRKVDAPRFCKPLTSNQVRKKVRILQYQCKECHQIYRRKRKVDTSKYACGKCRGALIYQGFKEEETAK